MGKSAWDAVRTTFKSEQESAINSMFPAESKFQMKQMTTEYSKGSIVPFAMLGLFRRLYKSKVLAIFQEEYSDDNVSLERQGRFELRDIISSRRAAEADKDTP